MFNNYSSNDNVQLPPIRAAGQEASQPHTNCNLLALPYVCHQLSYAPNASCRYDDVPEYPGRLHKWYTHVDESLSPPPSPVLVPTAPASPLLPTSRASPPIS